MLSVSSHGSSNFELTVSGLRSDKSRSTLEATSGDVEGGGVGGDGILVAVNDERNGARAGGHEEIGFWAWQLR